MCISKLSYDVGVSLVVELVVELYAMFLIGWEGSFLSFDCWLCGGRVAVVFCQGCPHLVAFWRTANHRPFRRSSVFLRRALYCPFLSHMLQQVTLGFATSVRNLSPRKALAQPKKGSSYSPSCKTRLDDFSTFTYRRTPTSGAEAG